LKLVHRSSKLVLALATCSAVLTAGTVTAQAAGVNPTSASQLAAAAGGPARVTELVGDGAWCWFQDPRAIHHVGLHDRTYVGYVTTKGDIDVLALDDPTGTVYQTVLHPRLVADDHAAPGLEVLPDGRIAVFYAGHVGATMYYRVSTNPEDVSSFGPELTVPVNVNGPYGYTYANPIYLSAEHRTYLFFRGADARPVMTYSDDNLQTWSPAHTLVLPVGAVQGQRPYAKYATNGTDTIYFTFDDGHPREIPTNSVYYMAYKGGQFTRADGTTIASLASVTGSDGSAPTPISNSQADLVYDGTGADGKAWVQDIAAGPDGRPVILFATFPNDSNHRYHYAAWNGTSWQQRDFTGGGGSIATIGGETEYSGGLSLDHNDPSVVYTSRQHGSAWEIQRWTTPDLGATFTAPVSITANSTVKNVRPVVPWGSPGPVKVLWMSGSYVHWKGLYNTSIQMLTTTRAPTTSRVSVSAAAVPSNQRVTVSARAVYGFGGGGVPGLPATLWSRPAGSADFHKVALSKTDANGLARFSVEQKRPTRYLVRFASTPAATGSDAPTVVVEQKVATEAHIAVAATTVLAGHRQHVTARLIDGDNGRPLAHQRVTIQERSGGQWQTLGRVITNAQGLATLTTPMKHSGNLRVVFPEQSTLGSATSASVAVHVTPVDEVHVSTNVSSIRSGKSAVVEARVVDAITGQGVAHAPVTLWARGLHSTAWHQVGTKTGTKADGTAHWTVQPGGATVYQVRAGHVGPRGPATSGSAIIAVHS
jgi:5-hydroxyisourate hydrolase-like protein (transthyretin family)